MRPLENARTGQQLLKTASQSEVDRWPELASWRGDRWDKPLVLWEPM